jgi:hypothetical protein
VTDKRQFGNPRAPYFGDKPTAGQPTDTANCGQCEAMLADALDGTLSPADQALFDLHVAQCGPCAQLLADARRGAAWLEMLRDPRPEPPPALLQRILAETSGSLSAVPRAIDLPGAAYQPVPAPIHGAIQGAPNLPALNIAPRNVLPFRVRAAAAVRRSSFAQLMLQPRLAMTAAMAFLSIALTLDLTGVRLQDLRVSDLRPSSLKRDFYSTNARVVQYYEGLRVVYELESRVHDLQSATDNDAPAASTPADPLSSPNQPASQPSPANQPPRTQPRQKPAPNSGTSRREDGRHTIQFAAYASRKDRKHIEGSLV